MFTIYPFLFPLKTTENLTVLWCFQGAEKECIGNKWVNNQYIFVQQYGIPYQLKCELMKPSQYLTQKQKVHCNIWYFSTFGYSGLFPPLDTLVFFSQNTEKMVVKNSSTNFSVLGYWFGENEILKSERNWKFGRDFFVFLS